MAATLGAAGDAVAARERTQFEEFAASRWTASVVADFSSGLPRTYRPVNVAGRKYVAIVAPPDNVLDRVSLFDSAGHEFGSAVAPVGGMTGTLPIGK